MWHRRLGLAAAVIAGFGFAGCSCGDETEDADGDGAGGETSASSASTTSTSTSTTASSSSSTGSGGMGVGGMGVGGMGVGGMGVGGAGGMGVGGMGVGGVGGAGGMGVGGAGGAAPGSCAMPIVAATPSTVNGDTTTAGNAGDGSCSSASGSGNEIVYELTPAATGTLELRLSSPTADMGVYIRTDCADPATEIVCEDVENAGQDELLAVPVTQGQKIYIIVDGYKANDVGAFTLQFDPQESSCDNGIDDDDNTLIDCEDPDCFSNAACTLGATCSAAPVALASNAGDTTTGTDDFRGSCTGDELAKEKLFSYLPAASGILSLTLQSATDQGLYVRTDCDDPQTQLACRDKNPGGQDEHLDVPVTMATPLTIFVDGYTIGEEGTFTLLTAFHASNETEPNDAFAQADVSGNVTFNGMIFPFGDEDWVSVIVPGPASTLTAEVADFGNGACLGKDIDSMVRIYTSDGTTQLAVNDDISVATNWCSLATATGLAAGTYLIRVTATPPGAGVSTWQFGYQLNITIN